MANLFTKDEDLKKSAPFIGFEILKLLQVSEERRISIFDIAKNLSKTNNFSIRSVYFGMIFLYSLSLIEFDEPYVIQNVES
jgi:hypothetical protein